MLLLAAPLALLALSTFNKAWALNTSGMQAERSLHFTLAPIQQQIGGAKGIRVIYDLSGFSGTQVSLDFDTLEPMLRRTTDQIANLKAEDGSGGLTF